jgi:hypothetical protein
MTAEAGLHLDWFVVYRPLRSYSLSSKSQRSLGGIGLDERPSRQDSALRLDDRYPKVMI